MFALDRHRRAATMLLAALALRDEQPEIWHDCAFVLHVRLTTAERAGLAFAALRALEPDDREQVFCAAHWGEVPGAGAPPPPFLNVMDDSRWWASFASRRELKAYALAAFEALDDRDRSAFLAHVAARRGERRAA